MSHPHLAAAWLDAARTAHRKALDGERAVRAAGQWRARAHRLAERLNRELGAGAVMRRALRDIASDGAAHGEHAAEALTRERAIREASTPV